MKKCFLKTTLLAAVLCAVGGGYGSAALYGISIEYDGVHYTTNMSENYDNYLNGGNSFLGTKAQNIVTGSYNKIGEKTTEGTFATGGNSVYGFGNKLVPHNVGNYSQIFGSQNNVGSSTTTVIGHNNNVAYDSKNKKTLGSYTYNTVLGDSNTVNGGSYGVAIGYNNSVSANYGVAIGANASANGESSVAIGHYATTSADSAPVEVAENTYMTTVSFGAQNKETSGNSYFARLKNVYAGEDDYDAVNVKQLKEYVQQHSGTTYIAGDNVEISDDNVISVKAEGKVESGDKGIVTGGAVYDHLSGIKSDLEGQINKVGAGAAALAALHPEDFDSNDKLSFAFGYGHYRNANAGALGAFYKPNRDTTVSFASTIGNGNPMMNIGVSFKIGRRGEGVGVYSSNAEMAREMNVLRSQNAEQAAKIENLEADNALMKADNEQIRADNEQMRADNAQMKADNENLRAQIAQIMKKLELSETVEKTAAK